MKNFYFNSWPIIGGLYYARSHHYTDAFKEFITGLLMSTIPLTMGAVVIDLIGGALSGGYIASFGETIKYGELNLYAASISAPILYIALKSRGHASNYPSKISHIVLIILVVYLPSVVIYSLQRAGVEIDQNKLFNYSLVVFATSVALYYVALVYNNMLDVNPLDREPAKDNEYVESLRRHRE